MMSVVTKAELAERWGRDSLIGKKKMELDRDCNDYLKGIFMILLIAGAYIAMAQVTSHYFCRGDLTLKHVFLYITIISSVMGGACICIASDHYVQSKRRRDEFFKPLTIDQRKELILKEKALLETAKGIKIKVEGYRFQEGHHLDASQLMERALEIEDSETARLAADGSVTFIANVIKILIIMLITVFAIVFYISSGIQSASFLQETTGITSAGLVALFLLHTFYQIAEHKISPEKCQELEEARITKLDTYISEVHNWTFEEA
jgi:hypothetical protein